MALTFFHGTSSVLLPAILRDGLVPQQAPQSGMRGNLSTIPGFTECMVFLAPVAHESLHYAQAACEKLGGEPVVLKVRLADDAQLHASDDYILGCTVTGIEVDLGLLALTNDDYDTDGDLDISYSTRAATRHAWTQVIASRWADLIWADFPALMASAEFQEHLNEETLGSTDIAELEAALHAGRGAYEQALKAPWRSSISTDRDPAVAFEGSVPPASLRQLCASDMRKAVLERSRLGRGLGQPASYDLKGTSAKPVAGLSG